MPDQQHYQTLVEVKDFLFTNNERYTKLLNEVKSFLEKLKSTYAANQIYRCYSRVDNRHETNEFKSIDKITSKITHWRKTTPDAKLQSLHDIVGVSIVVFYEDDIDIVFKSIKTNCKSNNFEISPYRGGEETRRYTKYGYHAQHLVLESRSPNLKGLKCEVQIKTLLHDAWQAKTHDLIYKPQGELGVEHRHIMESFGESIQAIEIQSQTIRKLVTQDWEEEEDLRHAARITVIDWHEGREFKSIEIEKQFEKLLEIMQSKIDLLKCCDINDSLIRYLTNEISSLKNTDGGLEAAWPLIVCLASIRQDNHLNYLAKEYLDDWFEKYEDRVKACLYKSFSYHMIGERTEAIREIEEFLPQSNLKNIDYRTLKFNLVYYLIEEAGYLPRHSKEIKQKCDRYMRELEAENWEGLQEIAVLDTKGYYQIVFGETREEIEKGIRACQAARATSEHTSDRGKLFHQMHERIGWRRYLRSRP